jgi:predicted PilT family ATPase
LHRLHPELGEFVSEHDIALGFLNNDNNATPKQYCCYLQNTLQNQQLQAQSVYSASTTFVVVPDDKVGIIIGKQGATVKDIQNRLRVKIQIPQVAVEPAYANFEVNWIFHINCLPPC